ncbi:sideroflexin-2 isoform X2 [Cephus cinctus]|uniref:Sideroflexin-2 isoform X2 n=1 Tax=Cephus cinctus TaxID=211228 RepID=A0AAJ7W2W3_CEPCN|nr:sideroflexin-2 isoform X2 [Cephus cinctus]
MDGVRFLIQLVSHDKSPPDESNKKKKSDSGKNDKSQDSGKKESPKSTERINVDKPLWSQDNYLGRWRHFAFITDFRTIFVSEEKLKAAKKLCEDYKAKKEAKDTTRDEIIYAKKLRDSSFHPDNGELMNVLGRMSSQFPANVFITTGMLAFYKSAAAVIGWQFLNQSFNALVNYTNRNAQIDQEDDVRVIKEAFIFAAVSSCATALISRRILSRRGPVVSRWAPFLAVVVGNMVNLPIMRQREIIRGIPISPKDQESMAIMNSKIASIKAISECVICRIVMAAPGMILIPVIMNRIKPYCFYQLRPWIRFPVEISLCGALQLTPYDSIGFGNLSAKEVCFLCILKFYGSLNCSAFLQFYENKLLED